MDVVIANMFQEQLMNLDTDIIKCVTGEFGSGEIVEMFQNFFYDHLIIDVSALRSYNDYTIYEVLARGLDPDKIIFLLPEGSKLCTPRFLQHLISYGIYNFTTNAKGVSYLIKKPNSYQDVEKIVLMASKGGKKENNEVEKQEIVEQQDVVESRVEVGQPLEKLDDELVEESIAPPQNMGGVSTEVPKKKSVIIGVRNVTASAGATTLIYMMLKELALVYGSENVLAIEIDKTDFPYFYDKRMISVRQADLQNTLREYSNMSIILVDLNGFRQDGFCTDILYLLEPSTLKLNRLVRRNKIIFHNLSGRKVVLNQSILQSNDVFDFENEAGIKIFYNLPPLDERKRNSVVADLLSRMGLIETNSNGSSAGKIFGLFRR